MRVLHAGSIVMTNAVECVFSEVCTSVAPSVDALSDTEALGWSPPISCGPVLVGSVSSSRIFPPPPEPARSEYVVREWLAVVPD